MSIYKQLEILNQDLAEVTEQLIYSLAEQRAHYKKFGEHSIDLGMEVEELLLQHFELLEYGGKLLFEEQNKPDLKVVQFRPRQEADHVH